jgi:hypothetical protein
MPGAPGGHRHVHERLEAFVLHANATIIIDIDARGHESTNEVSRLQVSRRQTQDSRIAPWVQFQDSYDIAIFDPIGAATKTRVQT